MDVLPSHKVRQQTIPKVQLPRINEIIDQAIRDGADNPETLRRIRAEGFSINQRQLRFRLRKRGPGPNYRRTCPLKTLLAQNPDAVEIIHKIEYAMACTDSTTAFREAAQLLPRWLEASQVPAEGRLMLFMACCRSCRTEDELQELQKLFDQMRKKVDSVCRDRKLFQLLLRDQLEILRGSRSVLQEPEHADDDTLAADEQPYALETYGVHCNLALLLLLIRENTFRNHCKGGHFGQEDEEKLRALYVERSRMFQSHSSVSEDDVACIFECIAWLQDVLKEGLVRYPKKLSNPELQHLGNRQVLFHAFAHAVTESSQDSEGEFYPVWSHLTRHHLCISPADVLLTIAFMLANEDNPHSIEHHAGASRLFEWAQESLDWLKGLGPTQVFSRFIHIFIENNRLHLVAGGGTTPSEKLAYRTLWEGATGSTLTQDSEPEYIPSPVEGVPHTLAAPAALPEVVNPQDLLLSPRPADQSRLLPDFDTSNSMMGKRRH